AGHCGGAPASPDAATKATPVCPAGVENLESKDDSLENSPPPQLIETTATPGWRRAQTPGAPQCRPAVHALLAPKVPPAQPNVGRRAGGAGPPDAGGVPGDQVAVGGGLGVAAPVVDFSEGRGGQSELEVELVQVVVDIRVVEGVDDGDRLASTIADHAVEGNA